VRICTRRTRRDVERLAQRTQAAERLAEQGMMTGGLAHEIKNPLSSVGLNLQLIKEDLRDPPQAPRDPNAPASADAPTDPAQVAAAYRALSERVGRIRRRVDSLTREINRLRDILEDFLRFAGRVKLDRAEVDLHALIDELIDFFSPQASAAGVRIHTQLHARPALLEADAGLLKQALLNVMINATQAMGAARDGEGAHGGASELIIRTARVRGQAHDEIEIHLTDTGPGIADDVVERIFQPYFTTKRGGTGLGLPTSRRLIEEHGGTIRVHSEIGRGTDFVISLPAAGRDASSAEGAVAEDDAQVRQ